MEFSRLDIYGFGPAIRGMRNSFHSWDNSDSGPEYYDTNKDTVMSRYCIGSRDMELMQRLYKAGGSERKFMRTIQVWCDISAPLTWWKQFDTYKVGTTGLSTSTMHSITDKEFKLTDFDVVYYDQHLEDIIDYLNDLRNDYLNDNTLSEDGKHLVWRKIIDNLPESYIQLRTVNMNYEVVAHMINDRKNHKLSEWHEFCDFMLSNLPYLKEIMDV